MIRGFILSPGVRQILPPFQLHLPAGKKTQMHVFLGESMSPDWGSCVIHREGAQCGLKHQESPGMSLVPGQRQQDSRIGGPAPEFRTPAVLGELGQVPGPGHAQPPRFTGTVTSGWHKHPILTVMRGYQSPQSAHWETKAPKVK